MKNKIMSKIHFFWVLKMSSVYPFRAALYEQMFVLDKDALFHLLHHANIFISKTLKSILHCLLVISCSKHTTGACTIKLFTAVFYRFLY